MIGALELRLAELEARLGSSGGKGMAALKAAGTTHSTVTGTPRNRRDRGEVRRRMAPTRLVEHVGTHGPHGATTLVGGWVVDRREVIDRPVAPVEVIEHVPKARVCPTGDRLIRPAVDLHDVVVGRQRLSVRVVSLIATLREVGDCRCARSRACGTWCLACT